MLNALSYTSAYACAVENLGQRKISVLKRKKKPPPNAGGGQNERWFEKAKSLITADQGEKKDGA